jgi:hypothetical protein
MTFDDLCERLKLEDEVTLLEILDVTSGELVDLLEGVIFDKQQRIRDYYNEYDELDGEEIPYESH